MSNPIIQEHLRQLLDDASPRKLRRSDRLVIFSDLHLGNGRSRDDFSKNGKLFLDVVQKYYMENGYSLFLNGDIEELQKFSFKRIQRHWLRFYELLEVFESKNRLFRLLGNHDYSLHLHSENDFKGELYHAIKLEYKGHSILVFHGHQASMYYEKYNDINGILLRYIVNPLRIGSRSAAYDSRKRYRVEGRIYEFSSRNKIVSIIGHTHRPLFESLSRQDFLKFKIEQLCRAYTKARARRQEVLEKDIQHYKNELHHFIQKERKPVFHTSLYNTTVIVPCVFNSGCGIGKRGITCIEISDRKITLVHWFDRNRSKKYFEHYEHYPEPLETTDFYRMVLKEDHLDYIFTRIKLLT